MTRTKILTIVLLAASAFALAACDTCGDPIRAQNGDQMMACKGGTPR